MDNYLDRRGRPRVVITGMGAMSPLGHSALASWEAAAASRSGTEDQPAAPTTTVAAPTTSDAPSLETSEAVPAPATSPVADAAAPPTELALASITVVGIVDGDTLDLSTGDRVRITISGIGTLENPVAVI